MTTTESPRDPSARIPDHCIAGDGPITVFLLHGAYGSKAYFPDLIASLVGAGHRVVAWDAPGYGLSPLPGEFSIDTVARAAVRLIERTGGPTNVVLGHSMGGIVAPRVAALAPTRVAAIIVSASSGSFVNRSQADQERFLRERLDPLETSTTLREAALPVIRSMFASTSSGPLVDLVTEVAASTATETFKAAIRAITRWDGTETVRSLRLPLLAIAGEHDTVGRPEAMQRMFAQVPDAEFACIANAAHYGFAEQPAEFKRVVLDFIARRVGPARRGETA